MNGETLVSLLSLAGTLIGSINGILTANRLSNYQIEALEKKVDKHNCIIGRTAILEQDTKTLFNRLDKLREDIKDIGRQDND